MVEYKFVECNIKNDSSKNAEEISAIKEELVQSNYTYLNNFIVLL